MNCKIIIKSLLFVLLSGCGAGGGSIDINATTSNATNIIQNKINMMLATTSAINGN